MGGGRGRKEGGGDLGRRDGRDEVKMNEQTRSELPARTGAEKRDKTRGHEPAEGGGRGRLRGPSDCVRGPPSLENRKELGGKKGKLHPRHNCTSAGFWPGVDTMGPGVEGQGGPCARTTTPALPGTRFLPWSGPIQSLIRNRQEQATIRRAGEIARLSLIELGLAGLAHPPNQGTQVHPKKARPATVLFRFARSAVQVVAASRIPYCSNPTGPSCAAKVQRYRA